MGRREGDRKEGERVGGGGEGEGGEGGEDGEEGGRQERGRVGEGEREPRKMPRQGRIEIE